MMGMEEELNLKYFEMPKEKFENLKEGETLKLGGETWIYSESYKNFLPKINKMGIL